MATWLHLNKMALYQRGFKLVASYTCFTKLGWSEYRKKFNWYVADYECFTNGKQYLIRLYYGKGGVWDDVYDSKEKANAHMKRVLEDCTNYKCNKY